MDEKQRALPDGITKATALDLQRGATPSEEGGGAGARVLAQGSGALARQITELARRHNVLVLQDFVLSERLATVPVGSNIPDTVFTALSVMLDFLQQEDGRKPDKA
ncbi:MAG: EscU/YscU/HrcU family type III secretion system export apparatus switch protein [Pseudomonadota bacterium]